MTGVGKDPPRRATEQLAWDVPENVNGQNDTEITILMSTTGEFYEWIDRTQASRQTLREVYTLYRCRFLMFEGEEWFAGTRTACICIVRVHRRVETSWKPFFAEQVPAAPSDKTKTIQKNENRNETSNLRSRVNTVSVFRFTRIRRSVPSARSRFIEEIVGIDN